MTDWASIKKIFRSKREKRGNRVTDDEGEKRAMASAALACGDVLDISMVTQKYKEFKELLDNNQSIEISAEELQRVDGAGIQLLVALFREAKEKGLAISWHSTSESLLEAASLLGVKAQLHLN
jgi:ABC-type transporter Mla MlaB component